MFVARDNLEGTRVTTLAPAWQGRTEKLRALAASGRLVCVGCGQKIVFRAGERRRFHFAHRTLEECPLSRQSPEVLEAKAQLYQWLSTKFPDKVEMDVDLRIPGLERFADVVVRPDDQLTFTYWVFDRTPRDRFALMHNLPQTMTKHVLYTASERHVDATNDALLLSSGKRSFIGVSAFDMSPKMGHMHFVDVDLGKVSLYRGLYCDHEPNVYKWSQLLDMTWAQCRISPRTGEIVADGERECDLGLGSRISETPGDAHETTRDSAPDRHSRIGMDDSARYRFSSSLWDGPKCEPTPIVLDSALRCERCGQMTTDYSVSVPSAGTCVCRACHPDYLAERLGRLKQDQAEPERDDEEGYEYP